MLFHYIKYLTFAHLKKLNLDIDNSFWVYGTDLGSITPKEPEGPASKDKYIWLSTGEPLTYSNFAPNEPNNLISEDETEHCLEINDNKKWNDYSCTNGQRYFICQIGN